MLGGKRENLMKNGQSTDSSNQTRSSTHHSCSQSFWQTNVLQTWCRLIQTQASLSLGSCPFPLVTWTFPWTVNMVDVKQQLRQFEEQSLDIFFIESYLRTCCLLLVSTVRCNTLGSTWQKPIRFAKTTNKSGCSPLHSAALDPVYLSLAPSWNVMTCNTQLLWKRTNHAIQVMIHKHNSYRAKTNHVIQVMIHKHTTLIRKNQPCHPGHDTQIQLL